MYTLSHLLESGILPNARLLTAPVDFSHIEICSVSVQEFPLDDFIQKNELVLSTALGCDADPDRFALLVQGAVDAGAAAVAFAFKNIATAIPSCVLATANAAELPLFQIPWELHFSKIQSAVLSAVQEDRLAVFHHTQSQLFDLFFESNSLDSAAACIAGQFDCPVCITDAFGEELAVSASYTGADHTAQTQIKIHLNGVLMGNLYLSLPPAVLNEKEPLFEKFLAFPLSLWFNKRHIENMTALRLKNDFIRNLATGNYDSFQEMAQQGARLHFDLGKPYTCIVMKAELRDGQSGQPEYSNQIAEDAAEIEKIMLQEGKRRQLSTMVANLSLEFTIYLENQPYFADQEVQDYVDRVEEKIAQDFPAFQCRWGISETNLHTPDFRRLYANASLALQYCMNTRGTRHRLTYKDTKKELIISVLSSHDDVRKNAQELLQPLMDYDNASNMGLFLTLVEYLCTNYNVSQTARNLHIHRQSLLYRMEKIEQLTEMSLHNHGDLFVLEAMARIYAAF